MVCVKDNDFVSWEIILMLVVIVGIYKYCLKRVVVDVWYCNYRYFLEFIKLDVRIF